jgi:CRISPR-associated protein Cmr1
LPRKAPLPSLERRYRFLTYVFGGGVKVNGHEKHADAVTPIRGASLRGQLRFWWRACNPSGCKTLDELRKREGEIWGTTSQASKVDLAVVTQPAKPRNVVVYEVKKINGRNRLETVGGMREIAYGAFPLQPSREALDTGARPWDLFDYGSSPFVLRLRFPEEFRADVEAALWAWETFGGLGGRTRRGFGAVAREDGKGTGAAAVRAELAKYQDNPRIAGVPSLHQARFAVARVPRGALDAWKKGLGLLQTLRQGPNAGRNPPSRPKTPAGRSRWPEPDEIRRLTGKAAPRHSQPSVSVQRFPRAAFGMPIVFHFHPGSSQEPDSLGDPKMKNLQLQPRGDRDRFASPLILRPIPDGKGSFLAAALVLASDVPNCELVADHAVFPVEWALDPGLARQIPALHRNGKVSTDPLQLFLEELQK